MADPSIADLFSLRGRVALVTDAIAAAGHEIQLHLHPAWQVFSHADWREIPNAVPMRTYFPGA